LWQPGLTFFEAGKLTPGAGRESFPEYFWAPRLPPPTQKTKGGSQTVATDYSSVQSNLSKMTSNPKPTKIFEPPGTLQAPGDERRT
jgi:hypothetical protein